MPARESIFSYDQIIITTGGSEAILFGFLGCLDAGDEVIIPEPFYANYNGFAVEAGVRVVPVTSYIETGFALPSPEDFEKAITKKTRAIVICNPNNPTGYLYSREEWNTLKNLALKYNLYLFSDEAYREFCYEGIPFQRHAAGRHGSKCGPDGYDFKKIQRLRRPYRCFHHPKPGTAGYRDEICTGQAQPAFFCPDPG